MTFLFQVQIKDFFKFNTKSPYLSVCQGKKRGLKAKIETSFFKLFTKAYA